MESRVMEKLSDNQKKSLNKGNIKNIADLLLASPQEVAGKCKISQMEAKRIIEIVYSEANPPHISRLEDVVPGPGGNEKCTTGNPKLDEALGGGVWTGVVWEIVGESAAGKTQFALQLSLFAQLPIDLGGLYGSTCYLTTSSKIPTSRLVQIAEAHPMLSSSDCGLKDVHTISTPTIPILIHVLSHTLPPFISDRSKDPKGRPVRLLVVDALAELFHTSNKTTTDTLVERSKNISEISALLHSLASTHQIAIIILNEVVDVFDQHRNNADEDDLVYSDQARWFSRANTVSGEDRKEASLGLVWANQVNVRILLSRTGRRRYLEDPDKQSLKRQKGGGESHCLPSDIETSTDNQLTLIRRLSVVFSSVSYPVSFDYIVTLGGIHVLSDDATYPCADEETTLNFVNPPAEPRPLVDKLECDHRNSQMSPLDIGTAEDGRGIVDGVTQVPIEDLDEDEWDRYWAADDTLADIYHVADLDPPNSNPVS